ncbi:CHAT domain-containing protein [Magnetococcales bacterium HHB-1]
MTSTIRFYLHDQKISRENGASRPFTRNDRYILQNINDEYRTRILSKDSSSFLQLGEKLYQWLDGDEHWLAAFKAQWNSSVTDNVWIFIFSVPLKPEEFSSLFIDTPWELLANEQGFLAHNFEALFCPVRRLGDTLSSVLPRYSELSLMMMTAAPWVQNIPQINFEEEERKILTATESLPFKVMAEESGNLICLAERVVQEERAIDILHISCHGDQEKDVGTAYLWLEDEWDQVEKVTAKKLLDALGKKNIPPLIFISSCHSAKNHHFAISFAHQLVQEGAINVVGWADVVEEYSATDFASVFYKCLGEYVPIEQAMARARQKLMRSVEEGGSFFPKQIDWHLARLYLGPRGGGQLCSQEGISCDEGKRTQLQNANIVHDGGDRFTFYSFVGRRQTLKQILKIFRGMHLNIPGILIHGLGKLGKSSLAVRVADRMTTHQSIMISRSYQPVSIFDTLSGVLLDSERLAFKNRWRQRIIQDETQLQGALQEICEKTRVPLLLILDNLEQTLETPDKKRHIVEVKGAYKQSLSSILLAVRKISHTNNIRLLLTSRYRFKLMDSDGHDLAKDFLTIALSPMSGYEQKVQLQTACYSAQHPRSHHNREYQKIIELACGIPGFQNQLLTAFWTDEKMFFAATAHLDAYFSQGILPTDALAASFFQEIALEYLFYLLNLEQTQILQIFTFFMQPVPQSILDICFKTLAIENARSALSGLLSLGLIYHAPVIWQKGEHVYDIHPLIRKFFPSQHSSQQLASAVVEPLFNLWREGEQGEMPVSEVSVALARLTLLAQGSASIMAQAAFAGGQWLFKSMQAPEQALNLVERAIFWLYKHKREKCSLSLLQLGGDLAKKLGKYKLERAFLREGLKGGSSFEQAKIWLSWGSYLAHMEKWAEAEVWLKRAKIFFTRYDDKRMKHESHNYLVWVSG